MSTLSLTKGQNVPLSKLDPSATQWHVGLAWNPRVGPGQQFDLDGVCFLLGADGKVTADTDMVFFNALKHPSGAVVHRGDNLTGAGDGDDEILDIDTTKIPANIDKLVFGVAIYDAQVRGQNFGQVPKASITLYNGANAKLATYDLSEDSSTAIAMLFGELYRNPSNAAEWKFRALGTDCPGGLQPLAKSYGVNV